jgi:hypothetical protein
MAVESVKVCIQDRVAKTTLFKVQPNCTLLVLGINFTVNDAVTYQLPLQSEYLSTPVSKILKI